MNDDLYYFMDAHNDDDAPDGAWWGILENSVTLYNEGAGTCLDPYEMVHAYIERKAEEQRNEKS